MRISDWSSDVCSSDLALHLLHALDARLRLSAQLCGATRGLTDMAIFPFVRQFAAIDPDWFAAQSLFHLSRWLNEHLASRLFADAMLRVAPWRESEDRKSTRLNSSH